MNQKSISPAIDAIQRRFFQAIDHLTDAGKMVSLSAFCESHNLNRVKYSNLRTYYQTGRSATPYRLIDLDAPVYLSSDFGVSLSWIMKGSGREFI